MLINIKYDIIFKKNNFRNMLGFRYFKNMFPSNSNEIKFKSH